MFIDIVKIITSNTHARKIKEEIAM